MAAEGTGRRAYGMAPAVGLRGVGVGAAGVGACLVAAVLLRGSGLSGGPAVALGGLVAAVTVVALTVLTVGALRVAGRGPRLVLDDDGFTNATGPGGGVRRAAWKDVRTVRVDGPVVLVDLAGGRRSVVRTGALDVDAAELSRELRARLNRRR